MAYIIYTERIGGNGSTYRFKYECNLYHIDNGIIEFWNPKLTERTLIPLHTLNHIMIQDIGDKKITEKTDMKGEEIKCTT